MEGSYRRELPDMTSAELFFERDWDVVYVRYSVTTEHYLLKLRSGDDVMRLVVSAKSFEDDLHVEYTDAERLSWTTTPS